jgi:hypothetical protein
MYEYLETERVVVLSVLAINLQILFCFVFVLIFPIRCNVVYV